MSKFAFCTLKEMTAKLSDKFLSILLLNENTGSKSQIMKYCNQDMLITTFFKSNFTTD